MPVAQADVPDDIFINPSDEIGKKFTLEIKQAKQRKKELKPPSQADQEAIKIRIDIIFG